MKPSRGRGGRVPGDRNVPNKQTLGASVTNMDPTGLPQLGVTSGMTGVKTMSRGSPQGRVVLKPLQGGAGMYEDVLQNTPGPAASPLSRPTSKPRKSSVTKAPTQKKRANSRICSATKLPSKPVLPDIDKYENIILGTMDNLPAPTSNIVRIFLSSTFSDFKIERNALAKQSYPVLKTFCRDRQLEFQVVDLRWGITDEATNDHSVERLCLQEIQHCQALSQGPNFVLMLGKRYGYRPLVPEIEAGEFETLMKIMQDNVMDKVDLVKKWYKRDSNAIPAIYNLQPIRSQLPHFADSDPANKELRQAHSATWNDTHNALHTLFKESSAIALKSSLISKAAQTKYINSVTEEEIDRGLHQADPTHTCAAFIRTFTDINLDPEDRMAMKYFNFKDGTLGHSEVDQLMDNLRENKVPGKLGSENIHKYEIKWSSGGVNKVDHKTYLDNMCEDFVNVIKTLIQKYSDAMKAERTKECQYTVTIERATRQDTSSSFKGNKSKMEGNSKGKPQPFAHLMGGDAVGADMFMGLSQMKNMINTHKEMEKKDFEGNAVNQSGDRPKLNAEILHHLYMCKKRCETFCGRENELEQIKKYLKKPGSSKPLIVHAPSGAGKTAFAAMIAKTTKSVSSHKCVTIVRFLGTSPSSSTLLKVLSSVCEQICVAYGEPVHKAELSRLSKAISFLPHLLAYVSAKYAVTRPLYIILDSVDQLSPGNGAHHGLEWLPLMCPANVKIIVTFIPDMYNLLNNAKKHLGSKSCFLALELLTPKSAQEMCEKYLKIKKRTLNEEQMNVLQEAVLSNAHPLLVKLWLNTALSWKSYSQVAPSSLPKTVQTAVETLFSKLEMKYGESVIKTTLGFITLCKDGMSEVELEDALSCTDEILSDVYRYHSPPVEGQVRIPPLLWARIRDDLKEYIVERQSQSRRILAWYHRQFIEAALRKYGSGEECSKLHSQLADFFLVEETLKRTIYLKYRNLTVEDADRGVDPKYLVPSNTRKLVALFYHLTSSGDLERCKSLLEDFRYLQCFAEALSHVKYRDEAAEALEYLNIDDDCQLIVRAVNLCQSTFTQDITSFPVQLLAQLLAYQQKSALADNLCNSIRKYIEESAKPFLVPVTPLQSGSEAAPEWYIEGPSRILHSTGDGHQILVTAGEKHPDPIVCQVVDCTKANICKTLKRSKNIGKDLVLQGLLSEMSSKAFILTTNHVLIWSIGDDEAKVQYECNNINKKGKLNSVLLVSKDDQYIILAGAARLAMLELTDGEYKVKRVMDLQGSTATTNIIFSDDVAMTLSSHSIKGKGKYPFGAIVCWDFWEEKLKVRVAVSAPVVTGCLHKMTQCGMPNIVLCACTDGKLFTVDMEEGKVLKQFANTPFTGEDVLSVFHPQLNTFVLSGKGQSSLEIWDVMNASKMQDIKIDAEVLSVNVTGNGSMVAIGTTNGNILLNDVDGGSLVASMECHTGAVTSILAEESCIFSVGDDSLLQQWSIENIMEEKDDTQKDSADDVIHTQSVTSHAVIGSHLITGSDGGKVISWNISNGQRESVLTDSGEYMKVVHTPDSNILLAWDTTSGKVSAWDKSLKRLETDVSKNAMHVESIGSGRFIICSEKHGQISAQIADIPTQQFVDKIIIDENPGNTQFVKVSLMGGFMMILFRNATSDDGHGSETLLKVRILDMTSGAGLEMSQSEIPVYSADIIDSKHMILGTAGRALVWNISMTVEKTMKQIKDLKWLAHNAGKNTDSLQESPISFVKVINGATQLVTGSTAGQLRVWPNILLEDNTKATPIILKGHMDKITCAAATTSGRHLVTGSRDRTVRIWHLDSGTQITMCYLHKSITAVTLTPDDQQLIVQTNNKKASMVSIWKCPTSPS